MAVMMHGSGLQFPDIKESEASKLSATTDLIYIIVIIYADNKCIPYKIFSCCIMHYVYIPIASQLICS